jgi:hypothetical protein
VNKKHVIIAALVGVVIGIAYGAKLPLLPMLASKLPGATPAAA